MESYRLIQNHDHILSEIVDNVCAGSPHLVSPYQEIPCLIQSRKDFHAQSKRTIGWCHNHRSSINCYLLKRSVDPWHVGKIQDLC